MKYAGILVPTLLLAFLLPRAADAENRPRPMVINVDDSTLDLWDPAQGPAANKLFLNRCPGGCIINVGSDSSINNRSSIINSTSVLSEWAHGDEAWGQLVSCVEGVFEPFNIQVTDVEPAGGHHEVMVAGTTSQFQNPSIQGALGVSPGTCGVINNSLTFVFANIEPRVAELCWAVAQEPGHSWGLDHEMLCEDPMTYLRGCGSFKTAFQNQSAPCGEDQNRSCRCGGSTQNSYSRISQIFGVDGGDPPVLTIVRPMEAQLVRPNFPIEVQVDDSSPIGPVDVLVDGVLVGSSEFQPYVFNAPGDLDFGNHTVEVRATDIHGASGTTTITVEVSEEAPEDPDNPSTPPDEGGCQTSNGSAGGFALLLLGLFLGGVGRRRR